MCETEIGFSRRSKGVVHIDNLPILMINVRMYMTKKGSRGSLSISLIFPVNFTEVYCTSKNSLISNNYFVVFIELCMPFTTYSFDF